MDSRPEPDGWLHSEVEVQPSPIEGQGLFTRARIPAGTVVARLGGRLVSGQELLQLLEAAKQPGGAYVDTIVVAEDLHLVIAPGQPIHHGNHSCDPNLWWSGPYTLVARRVIEAGEELTNDYATSTQSEGFTTVCSCGSSLCRRHITGRDWRRGDLQDRYGEHWVPVLLSRVANER